MIEKYTIDNNNIYITLSYDYDFGSFDKNMLINEINKIIKNSNNKFQKYKVYLLASGIILGCVFIEPKSNNIEYQFVPDFKKVIEVNIEKNNVKIVKNDILEEKEKLIDIDINVNDNKTYSGVSKNIINNTINNENKSNNNQNNSINNENNDSKEQQIQKQNDYINEITVYRSNGEIIKLDLDDYVVGVVAAEMPASFNDEALKAQSVLARTYALKAKQNSKKLTDTVSTQCYIDNNQMKTKWGLDYQKYLSKITSAVESTKGETIKYNNQYIEAMYHSTNNGKTESSLDVFGNYYPYLISVSSEYDKNTTPYYRETIYSYNDISNKLNINVNKDTLIEIISKTDGDNIKEIKVSDNLYTGKQIRELLGLRSADFDIIKEENSVKIITRGYGHGVGMSQYGANQMANYGYKYNDILIHYYPNTQLTK